jgi:MutS domain V
MKAFLMYAGGDLDTEAELPSHRDQLIADLELNTVFRAMANDDQLLYDMAKRGLLLGLQDPEEIFYRQQVLEDCLHRPAIIRELYQLAGDAIASEKTIWRSFARDSPSGSLPRSVKVLQLLAEFLRRLRSIADDHAPGFESPGMRRFFQMLIDELSDDYLARLDSRLNELEFPGGHLFSAALDAGNRAAGHMARRQPQQGWLRRLAIFDRSGYSFTIPARDDSGFAALREIEDKGLNVIANALAQSCDHVLSFFQMLRIELAFYVGALNLRDQLQELGAVTCIPELAPGEELALSAAGLYDVALTLTLRDAAVCNDLDADGRALVIITGANQGGKSTLLRAVAVAQLMTQAGLFAPSSRIRVDLRTGVFTHYKREEDETMQSGKLDEELRRMSEIADRITPGGMLLCNESFASTNEREGSEIARQVIGALVDEGVKVLCVTHQYDLAHGFYVADSPRSLFLRAGRDDEGERSYKITPGEPLSTSYGEDSYQAVFGSDLAV